MVAFSGWTGSLKVENTSYSKVRFGRAKGSNPCFYIYVLYINTRTVTDFYYSL